MQANILDPQTSTHYKPLESFGFFIYSFPLGRDPFFLLVWKLMIKLLD